MVVGLVFGFNAIVAVTVNGDGHLSRYSHYGHDVGSSPRVHEAEAALASCKTREGSQLVILDALGGEEEELQWCVCVWCVFVCGMDKHYL